MMFFYIPVARTSVTLVTVVRKVKKMYAFLLADCIFGLH